MIASARKAPRTLRPFFALFGTALFLLLARDTEPVLAVQGLGARLLVPIERAASDAGEGAAQFVATIAEIERLRAESSRLRVQVDSLTLENVRLRERATAAEQAARLGAVAANLPFETVGAEVIARDPTGFVRTLTIDAGSEQGVAVGHVVVVEQGVVGRVTAVFPIHSRVLPITDSASSVVATVQRSRASGIVRGLFGDTLVLEWVLQNEEVAPGDLVITAGLALSDEVRSLYPKGLVIGTVAEVQKADVSAYQKAVITPAVDFRRLERVLVVRTN
jgi:rod shape-determining protein MreC